MLLGSSNTRSRSSLQPTLPFVPGTLLGSTIAGPSYDSGDTLLKSVPEPAEVVLGLESVLSREGFEEKHLQAIGRTGVKLEEWKLDEIGLSAVFLSNLEAPFMRLRLTKPQSQSLTHVSPGRCPWLLRPDSVKITTNELGVGTFGTVYRSEFLVETGLFVLTLPAATKVVSLAAVAKSEVEKEVEILAELSHPSVLTVYGCYFDSDKAMIVTELCENGDIQQYLNKNNPKVDQRLKILSAVAQGMQYIHDVGIVHRDLKPSNVLLTKELVPKICDFGISEHGDSQGGEIVGTPRFIADPKLFGDARSRDIYAFGMMAYEVLSSKVVFADLVSKFSGLRLVKEIHRIGEYPDVADLFPTVERTVRDAVLRCWKPGRQVNFGRLATTLQPR